MWKKCHQNTHIFCPLQWRHNGRDSVSNHQPHDCLLNRLFRRRSKKTSKLRVTGLCAGIHRGPVNSPHKWPVTRKMFPFDDVIIPGNTVSVSTVTFMMSTVTVHLFKSHCVNLFCCSDAIVSYTRPCETSAGCLRSIYLSLGMRQLFGDVTMGQWRHN